jgi:hypothetical protein
MYSLVNVQQLTGMPVISSYACFFSDAFYACA